MNRCFPPFNLRTEGDPVWKTDNQFASYFNLNLYLYLFSIKYKIFLRLEVAYQEKVVPVNSV